MNRMITFLSRFDPEADMHTISQVENPSASGNGTSGVPGGPPGPGGIPMNEDSNHSAGGGSGSGGEKEKWASEGEGNSLC